MPSAGGQDSAQSIGRCTECTQQQLEDLELSEADLPAVLKLVECLKVEDTTQLLHALYERHRELNEDLKRKEDELFWHAIRSRQERTETDAAMAQLQALLEKAKADAGGLFRLESSTWQSHVPTGNKGDPCVMDTDSKLRVEFECKSLERDVSTCESDCEKSGYIVEQMQSKIKDLEQQKLELEKTCVALRLQLDSAGTRAKQDMKDLEEQLLQLTNQLEMELTPKDFELDSALAKAELRQQLFYLLELVAVAGHIVDESRLCIHLEARNADDLVGKEENSAVITAWRRRRPPSLEIDNENDKIVGDLHRGCSNSIRDQGAGEAGIRHADTTAPHSTEVLSGPVSPLCILLHARLPRMMTSATDSALKLAGSLRKTIMHAMSRLLQQGQESDSTAPASAARRHHCRQRRSDEISDLRGLTACNVDADDPSLLCSDPLTLNEFKGEGRQCIWDSGDSLVTCPQMGGTGSRDAANLSSGMDKLPKVRLGRRSWLSCRSTLQVVVVALAVSTSVFLLASLAPMNFRCGRNQSQDPRQAGVRGRELVGVGVKGMSEGNVNIALTAGKARAFMHTRAHGLRARASSTLERIQREHHESHESHESQEHRARAVYRLDELRELLAMHRQSLQDREGAYEVEIVAGEIMKVLTQIRVVAMEGSGTLSSMMHFVRRAVEAQSVILCQIAGSCGASVRYAVATWQHMYRRTPEQFLRLLGTKARTLSACVFGMYRHLVGIFQHKHAPSTEQAVDPLKVWKETAEIGVQDSLLKIVGQQSLKKPCWASLACMVITFMLSVLGGSVIHAWRQITGLDEKLRAWRNARIERRENSSVCNGNWSWAHASCDAGADVDMSHLSRQDFPRAALRASRDKTQRFAVKSEPHELSRAASFKSSFRSHGCITSPLLSRGPNLNRHDVGDCPHAESAFNDWSLSSQPGSEGSPSHARSPSRSGFLQSSCATKHSPHAQVLVNHHHRAPQPWVKGMWPPRKTNITHQKHSSGTRLRNRTPCCGCTFL